MPIQREENDKFQDTDHASIVIETDEGLAEITTDEVVVVPREKLAKLMADLRCQMEKVRKLIIRNEEIEHLIPQKDAQVVTGRKTDVPVVKQQICHVDDNSVVVSEGWLAQMSEGLKRLVEKGKMLLAWSKEPVSPDGVKVLTKSDTGQVEKSKELFRELHEMESLFLPERVKVVTIHEAEEMYKPKEEAIEKEHVDRPVTDHSVNDGPPEHTHETEDLVDDEHKSEPPVSETEEISISEDQQTVETEAMRRQAQKEKTPITKTEEIDSPVSDSIMKEPVSNETTDEIPPELQKPVAEKRTDDQTHSQRSPHQLKAMKAEWPADLKLIRQKRDRDTINQDYHLVKLMVDKDWKPKIIRQPVAPPEPDCKPTEHDADMVILDCSACTAKPSMFKRGVYVVCYNCQPLQADGTCMLDQKESVFRISTSYLYPSSFIKEHSM